MAAVLLGGHVTIRSIPENILLEIFRHLTVKDLCIVGRVCRAWRRVANDNSLWRHVDLIPYKLNLNRMWKVIRAHLSDVLFSLHLRGHMDPAGADWKRSSLSDAMLRDLQERCPNVKVLHLRSTNLTLVSATNLPDKLQKLMITQSLIPPGWFKTIADNDLVKDLTYLDLSKSTKTTNSDLKDIATRSNLTVLNINGNYRVTEKGLKVIAQRLPNLEVLEISETGCTDLALHHIGRGLTKLKRLNLSRCHQISNSGAETIADCLMELEWLHLGECKQLTDSGLRGFHKLKKLRHLVVTETGCTLQLEQLFS